MINLKMQGVTSGGAVAYFSITVNDNFTEKEVHAAVKARDFVQFRYADPEKSTRKFEDVKNDFDFECSDYVKRVRDEIEAVFDGRAEAEDTEDGAPVSLYDYFADALDIEYRINSDRTFKAAYIYITLGGPTVWVDTLEGAVMLHWGSTEARAYLRYEVKEEIEAMYEEYYNMIFA